MAGGNLVRYFLDGNLERGRADSIAIVHADRAGREGRRTFGEVAAEVSATAAALVDLGLEPEHRVLLALGDGPEFVAAWFAAVKCGGVAASVNPLLPAEDYAYYLEYTRARVAFCDQDSLPRFLEVLPGARWLRALVVAEGEARAAPKGARAKVVSLADARRGAPAEWPTFDASADEIAVWLFTSGTTGKPKAAVHFHHDFVFNAEHYAKHVLQLTSADRTIGVPKLFFGYATGTNLLFPFAAGASTALFQERSKPEAVLANVERFRPTVMCAVPTTLNGLLALPAAPRSEALRALRYATSAGEALPVELYRRWKEATGVEVLDGIGSAEMFHVFISARLGEVRPGTLGRVVPGYEAKIVGPGGETVPDGEIGTLWVKGESAALCYWGAREKSRQTMHGDWVVSADLFRRDADGYFHYEGRADDMLKVGGIFVSPLEIESCLLAHPAVRECAVVGYTEDDLVKPEACVVLHDGGRACDALAAELQAFVKSRLAPYKYPRRVRFLDALPRNDRGKVEKKALREARAS